MYGVTKNVTAWFKGTWLNIFWFRLYLDTKITQRVNEFKPLDESVGAFSESPSHISGELEASGEYSSYIASPMVFFIPIERYRQMECCQCLCVRGGGADNTGKLFEVTVALKALAGRYRNAAGVLARFALR